MNDAQKKALKEAESRFNHMNSLMISSGWHPAAVSLFEEADKHLTEIKLQIEKSENF